jgi:hypothetical protein
MLCFVEFCEWFVWNWVGRFDSWGDFFLAGRKEKADG